MTRTFFLVSVVILTLFARPAGSQDRQPATGTVHSYTRDELQQRANPIIAAWTALPPEIQKCVLTTKAPLNMLVQWGMLPSSPGGQRFVAECRQTRETERVEAAERRQQEQREVAKPAKEQRQAQNTTSALSAGLPSCSDPEVVAAAQQSASVQRGSWSKVYEINGPGQLPPIPSPPFRNCHAEGVSGNWDYYIYVRDNDIKIRVYATGAWRPGGWTIESGRR